MSVFIRTEPRVFIEREEISSWTRCFPLDWRHTSVPPKEDILLQIIWWMFRLISIHRIFSILDRPAIPPTPGTSGSVKLPRSYRPWVRQAAGVSHSFERRLKLESARWI